ncbi:MAG: preprotein translocase subunit SecE [Gammaproteobacteria bacterium]|nr:preprotein translocase subunit SecE [Gammaproteobacteria bacterium]MDE0225422.1 preprotein translocase subunit SecE [Gammaproteobacteria bacterium]MDE0452223.1 preprotein translocase subunit SecE [Gammaproteobacteria bacterium]
MPRQTTREIRSDDQPHPIVDRLKWLVVAVMVGAGVFGNWYFGDQQLLNRVLALVALAVVAVFVILQTDRGRAMWNLAKEARTEIRRVVWPTRQETAQTTFMVVLLVLLFALVLWGLDSFLSWVVSSVIG